MQAEDVIYGAFGSAWKVAGPKHSWAEQAVEKTLLFARRITLGSAEIRFMVAIGGGGTVFGRRLRWRVGKARSGTWCDRALMGANSSVPVGVMRRRRVRNAVQGDQ